MQGESIDRWTEAITQWRVRFEGMYLTGTVRQRSVVRSHAGDVLIETLFEVVCRADVKGVVTGIAGCTSMALDDDATS